MNRLITSVLVSLVGLNALIQAGEARPKLVVNIVVDQLRTADLEYLQTLFGNKGFNRLIREGAYLRDIDFHAESPDIANTTALLATGAHPGATGVPAASLFDNEAKRMVKTLSDKKYNGVSTSESFSPVGIRLSTVSDEIAVSGNGLSLIYSIAADPQQAVILGGHAANAAVWIDPNTGKWASSSYYKEIPGCVSQRNQRSPLSSRIDTMVWKPALSPERYRHIPADKKRQPFQYTFSSGRDSYSRFAATPLANREITDLAIDCLQSMRMGRRYSADSGKSDLLGEPVDVLNIGYALNPLPVTGQADASMEQQDAYIRLDAQLTRLLDAIDRSVGLSNSLVVLSSTGYFDERPIDAQRYRIPSGEFSTSRAASLLNSYLSARFGNDSYVDTFIRGQVYLNRSNLERKGLDVAAVAEEARDFLLKMSGVNNVYTQRDLANPSGEEASRLRLSNDPKTSGDVMVTFVPGWNVSEDYNYPPTQHTVSGAATVVPAFFLGAEVVPEVISATVDATAIAPTVTQILRIRSPNGAVGRPLLLNTPAR